jgi:hypothetical protein
MLQMPAQPQDLHPETRLAPAGRKQKPGRFRDRAGCAGCRVDRRADYRLLRFDELFSPCWLLRLLVPRLALARSLCARLFWLLALAPLLAALLRPEDDDDLELRDAIDISLDSVLRPTLHARDHSPTLGARSRVAVGNVCALT